MTRWNRHAPILHFFQIDYNTNYVLKGTLFFVYVFIQHVWVLALNLLLILMFKKPDRLVEEHSRVKWAYLPLASVGWFMTLVLTTSAGVPMIAATSPAQALQIHIKSFYMPTVVREIL